MSYLESMDALRLNLAARIDVLPNHCQGTAKALVAALGRSPTFIDVVNRLNTRAEVQTPDEQAMRYTLLSFAIDLTFADEDGNASAPQELVEGFIASCPDGWYDVLDGARVQIDGERTEDMVAWLTGSYLKARLHRCIVDAYWTEICTKK